MTQAEHVLLVQRLRDLADLHERAEDNDRAADTAETLTLAMHRETLLAPALLREAAEHVAREQAALGVETRELCVMPEWQPVDQAGFQPVLVEDRQGRIVVARKRRGWTGFFTVPGDYGLDPERFMPLPALTQDTAS